jgi:Spy/CpxP family protein refolding chaperone
MGLFHRHRRHRGWFAQWMMRRIGRKLKLDTQQQGRLEDLQGKVHEVHDDLRQVRRDTHAEVEKLISAEQLDRDAAKRLLAVPRHAMEDHMPEMVDSFADFFDSLNGEQRRRLLGLWQRHQHHHGIHA